MKKAVALFIASAVFGIVGAYPIPLFAQSSDASTAAIQKQIDDNNAQIEQLNREIEAYQKQLNATTEQKNTLINAINQLTLQNKQLASKIKVTKGQINTTQLQIKQLSGTITEMQTSIATDRAGLAESIRRQASIEVQPLSVLLLTSGGITTAWNDLQDLDRLQEAVQERVQDLGKKKQVLTDSKTAAEKKNTQLTAQQKTLQTQQTSLAVATKAKNDLLVQTKSQETTYQNIISQKRAQEQDLEAALSDLKAKYNVAVNLNQITPAGAGVLQWPLDSVRITQYFGNTPFAQSGAYNGKGHNGIDLAAPIGTPVRAALSGTVIGTGNTDTVRGCYSFGKWVMVKHGNGLNTMYAHFSQISAYQGQAVQTGDILGYSGETGYATGPHLHFGVYVSSATQIVALGQATNAKTPCANAVMPVAPLAGYLNPLNYLPAH